jgi:hypothetical protein
MKERFLLVSATISLVADVIALLIFSSNAINTLVHVSSQDIAGITAVLLIYGAGALWWKLCDRFYGSIPRPYYVAVALIITSVVVAPVFIIWLRVLILDDWASILTLGFAPVFTSMMLLILLVIASEIRLR